MKSKLKVIKFKNFITLKRGYDLPTRKRNNGDVPVLSSSGISSNHNESKVNGPGVITGRSGLIGSVYYIRKEFWPLNTTLYVTDFKRNNPLYVYYKLKTINLKNFATGSSVPTLNRNHLDSINVNIHDKEDQKKQVFILEKIDKKIDLNQQIIANLEELSQTLFKRWFVDFEFPNKDSNPYKSSGGEMVDSELGEIPKEWQVVKLETLIDNIKDRINAKSVSSNFPYVPIDLIPKRKLTFYNYKDGKEAKSSLIKFKRNDILLGNMRVYFHRVCLAPFEGLTRNTVFTLRPKNEKYTYYLINLINKDEFIEYASNNSKGSTMPYAVWEGVLDKIKVIKPPLNYLNQFNSKIKNNFELSISLLEQNRKLATLRDTLLPKLMSGEIEIPDDIEVNMDELSI
ncbi:MAG: restriction endonuclease subunit S [Staphylococcus epidermidis]|uniref:restriction endonuclease subunit S n=1 Tax=Staphylococcus epidermidis TaxID=1282 RepID=UPI00254D45F2|nr:restriction endonuclease subunit S [Staphylococcus epidermidis]MDK7342102.1 restriction endonuclease subunit S [Staphylococcus epidermidis]MDK7943603.1 restriction endonuclease subunit S [Staphylococcus epidermidis]MDK8321541.1 restriction endonuclease subunit S [Staphylococcus epidermidis]